MCNVLLLRLPLIKFRLTLERIKSAKDKKFQLILKNTSTLCLWTFFVVVVVVALLFYVHGNI